MVYGIWLSADGLTAQQYRQDVIANNLANVNTPGFKPDRVAFAERLNEAAQRGTFKTRHKILDGSTGGQFGLPVYTDYSQAHTIDTGSPLDVSLTKAGFFSIQSEAGVRYTRDGRFTLDTRGGLRHTASGGAVLDTQGNPILINPDSQDPIRFDARGRVTQGQSAYGQLGIVDFADPQSLDKVGDNLFSGARARKVETEPRVRQGLFESSGVEPATAMVDMISASRAYQMSASLISMQDESLGRLVNDVGRIG